MSFEMFKSLLRQAQDALQRADDRTGSEEDFCAYVVDQLRRAQKLAERAELMAVDLRILNNDLFLRKAGEPRP